MRRSAPSRPHSLRNRSLVLRACPWLAALALAGCGGDVVLTEVPPEILVTPLSLDFGQVSEGVRLELPITISNEGGGTLSVNATLSGATHPDLLLPGSGAMELGAGDEWELPVLLVATGNEPVTGEVFLASNDEGQPLVTVPIVSSAPQPDIDAPAVDLGVLDCAGPGAGVVPIANVGDAPLVISEIQVGLGISYELQPGASLPHTVDPGDELLVFLDLSSAPVGSFGGSVIVVSDDPDEPSLEVPVSAEIGDAGWPELLVEIQADAGDCVTLLAGDALSLLGFVSDPTQDVTGLVATWTSDTAGLLSEVVLEADGRAEYELTDLPAGSHVITLSVVDPCGQEKLAQLEIEVTSTSGIYGGIGRVPDGITFADGYLWIADYPTDLLYQVDPDTLGIIDIVSTTGRGLDGLAFYDGLLWVSFYESNQVQAIDPCDGSVVVSWFTNGPSDVDWDGVDFWVVEYLAAEIHRVDPWTGTILETFSSPVASPNGMEWDGTGYLVTSNAAFNAQLVRLAPDFTLDTTFPIGASDPRGVAWDGSRIWYTDGLLGSITSFVP